MYNERGFAQVECWPVAAFEVPKVREAGRDALDEAPLPHWFGVDLAPRREHFGPFTGQSCGVSCHQRLVVLAHCDSEVVRRLGNQTFGVDELECAITCAQRVPAVCVTVDEDRAGRIECCGPTVAERN